MDQIRSTSPRRRGRLQRSERLHSDSSYSTWEALVRESFGQIAWPIRITSWELLSDRPDIVPTSSSATELISRRGVFSRRHYGSVEQFPQSELEGLDQNCRRFRLENGESLAEKDEVFGSPSTPILENPEHQTRWYFKYFLGKLHQNYVGIDMEKSPYFLSIVSQDSGNKSMPLYRAILFRKQGAQKVALPYNPNQKLTVKQILSHFPGMDTAKTPKELFAADIQKDLLLLEEQEGSVNFKFGIVFMRSGQKVDDEMLSNEYGSEAFEDFLGVLGEKVRLKGWERYRGGLDVKGDMTGKYSVYTLYEGHEIMFHVSTLLPFSRDNRQQVERKRHIGNDIVNIVFVDGNTEGCEFVPNCIKSQFTHIFAVVSKQGRNGFRVAVFCDETVPPFGPTLPNPPEFNDPATFREFLLVKLINGEKATFQTPTFSRKRERTLDMLIKDLYEEYVHDSKMTMLNRRAFSEVLYDAPRASKLKEDARQVEFVRIGQALKLEAIVRGDAPTSLASAGPASVFKRPPWEPQCFYAAFCHRGALIGDSWGQDALFMATDAGVYLIREDQSNQQIFDKSLCVRQLTVVEDHGIMLIRGGSASHKDAHRIYVFRLNEFRDEAQQCPRTRASVKEHRIDRTRGCHLYTTAKGCDGHLRMAVAAGRKLITFQWRHTAAWTSWCPNSDHDTVDGFIQLREVTLHDSPTIMNILERPASSKTDGQNEGCLICIGFKNHFEIISEQSGLSTRVHETETPKRASANLVAALDLYDGQETELLLCYNHTCHFQKLSEETKNNSEFDFHWNTSPTAVVCAFPYIIAFTSESMEIRLLVNGNLVHTMAMAELQLISSKRDIYFATTAPEFIPRETKVQGPDTGYLIDGEATTPTPTTPTSATGTGAALTNAAVTSTTTTTAPRTFTKINDISSDKILEIKHKMERIEAASCGSQESSSSDEPVGGERPKDWLHVINAQDDLNRWLTTEPTDDSANSGISIQRARSLQGKHRDTEELKRPISKSNSCGETAIVGQEPGVPPNSPRLVISGGNSSGGGGGSGSGEKTTPVSGNSSPHRRTSRATSISNRGDTHMVDNQKPLRIYRIPLANLTGAHTQGYHHHHHHHHHHHYHSKNSKPRTSDSDKIVEDNGAEEEQPKIVSDTGADDNKDTIDQFSPESLSVASSSY